jgi:ComF family protein
VLPVPLHWRRLRSRGFDQGLEIGKVLARRLNIPLSTALRRQRYTASQQALSREQRQRNLAGAFILRKPLPALRVALVDDVLTTGSTANEISALLQNAGVEEVHVWAIARTP